LPYLFSKKHAFDGVTFMILMIFLFSVTRKLEALNQVITKEISSKS